MVNYPIGDMLIRINNAQAIGKEQISMPFSKVKFKIAQVLSEGGFIGNVERRKKKAKKSEIDYIYINIKYNDKDPAISGFKLISKPSRHIYVGADDIKSVHSGYGLGVISTSKGIMSSKDARKKNLGGEILFEVW